MARHLPDGTSVLDLVGMDNVADILSDDCLRTIGAQVVTDYTADENSRAPWVARYTKGVELAAQTQSFKRKNEPWENASNVIFPLLTIAAIQFHARAYPMLVPSTNIVHVKVFNYAHLVTGQLTQQLQQYLQQKVLRAQRVAAYMNYQFYYKMTQWETEMDSLILTLSATGSEFKKSYYDPVTRRCISEYVPAKDLVVNYNATSLEDALRITQIFNISPNEIIEHQNAGIFSANPPVSSQPRSDQITAVSDAVQGQAPTTAGSLLPTKFLEQHGYFDLDGDGYAEPYIFTVEHGTQRVFRIVARFSSGDVTLSNNVIQRIVPRHYYTHYKFLPSPDGGFYGMGFNLLLGTLNHAVNTLINQLVDSGTLYNLQAGFISKHFRLPGGTFNFKPGEWKQVNAMAQDIKTGLFPLPVREPSQVLYMLLQILVGAGERLASTTDIMVGESPGQNQKATTTMAVLEEGRKVFTAIYKRVRKALAEEISKIYSLNREYLDKEDYYDFFDLTIDDTQLKKLVADDFEDEELDIQPIADPNALTMMQKTEKAKIYLEMAMNGLLDRQAAVTYFLEAMEEDNIQRFLPQAGPIEQLQMQGAVAEVQDKQIGTKLAIREQARKERETSIREAQVGETAIANRNKEHIEALKAGADMTLRAEEANNADNEGRSSGVAKGK